MKATDKLCFNDWLNQELDKPSSTGFDPEGNSPRASMLRIRDNPLKQLWWVTKDVWKSARDHYSEHDGWDTSLGWIVSCLVWPIIIWFAPLLAYYYRKKRDLKEYKHYYEKYLNNQK